jgi:hypothetical protein
MTLVWISSKNSLCIRTVQYTLHTGTVLYIHTSSSETQKSPKDLRYVTYRYLKY